MQVPFLQQRSQRFQGGTGPKKKEVAKNQGVKKSKKRKISIGVHLAVWAFELSCWTPLDSYNFSPLQNRKVLCFAKTKNKEIQHISLFI